ncbi:MAG: (Fe-S)-binding protein [Chloroflexi bacterium]|nr:(Fe-S)-binding protein [Chloroflexota bacterium]
MNDPVNITILGLPGVAVLWFLTVLGFGVFGWRVYQLVSLLRRARPENRIDQLGRRLKLVAQHVLLQKRIFNERSIGWPHFLIFWGCVVFVSCFNWGLLRGLVPGLPIPYPDEVPVAALFLEVFGVLVLIAVGVAALRRAFFAPPHLHLSLDANVILILIAILMVSSLFGQGFKLVAEGTRSAWSPFGGLVAALFSSVPPPTARALAHASWWTHVVTVLAFVVYLPYSKHLHVLASPFNVFFGNLRSPGDLSLAGSTEDITAGSSRWEEFTWKQLLSGFSCAECGRCDRACPALNSGFALSPQQLIQKIKQHLQETGLRAGDAAKGNGHGAPSLIGSVISEAEIWSCTTCMSCMERCAVLNVQVPLIIQMRRHQVGQGAVERTVQDLLANLTRYGNSFGKSDRLRAKWTQGLGWKIKDARKEPVEYLWFVGDYASYDPRLEEITRTTARIFQQAGMDFGILYEAERNAGNDVRRIGEEGLFDMLRERNEHTFGRAKFKTIVTTDPHSYNTLKNEYHFNGNGEAAPVLHYSEVLDQLLQQGRLPLKRNVPRRVTFHDPCFLGRYNEVYDPPRRVLEAVGARVLEMPRNRARSYCCGAGGGRIWMEDAPGIQERPAESRVREAAALPVAATLVVACPKDIAMFRDAIKTTGHEGKIVVQDLAELVWEAMQP